MSGQVISFQDAQSRIVKQHNTQPVEAQGSTLRSVLRDVSRRVDETVDNFNSEPSRFVATQHACLLADLKGVALLLRAISDA